MVGSFWEQWLKRWSVLDYTDLQQDHIIFLQLLLYDWDGLSEGQHFCWKLFNLILHSCNLLFFFFFHSCYSGQLFLVKDLVELLKLVLDQSLCFQRLTLREIIKNSGFILPEFVCRTKHLSSHHRLPWCTWPCLQRSCEFFWGCPVYLANSWEIKLVLPEKWNRP